MSRFIDPTTDFGFKKLFGDEANRDIIISFLTDVLVLESPIMDIHFLDKEQLPESEDERTGIYDIFCQDADGNRFIVEMQKSRQAYVKDRMIYYSTFPIAAQAKKGADLLSSFRPIILKDRVRDVEVSSYSKKSAKTGWNFYLDAVYCVAILAYRLNGSTRAVNRNSLRNDEPPHEIFYNKLRFITIELPLFDETKPEYSLDNHLNKWLFFLKYLPDFDAIPQIFEGDEIFLKAFRIAEIVNLSPAERRMYHTSLKRTWDTYAALETSYNMGKERGKIEAKTETLLMLLNQKLGAIPPELENSIKSIKTMQQIDQILSHIFEIDSWESFNQHILG